VPSGEELVASDPAGGAVVVALDVVGEEEGEDAAGAALLE
jgi:hypothetical protein